MKKFIKVSLPFFKENHKFLLGKWWFRLLIVLYPIALVILIICLFSGFMDSYLKCYDTVIKIFTWSSSQYNQEFTLCREGIMNALPQAIGYAFIGTLMTHYVIQILFFKIVIDFVMMGKYKEQSIKN